MGKRILDILRKDNRGMGTVEMILIIVVLIRSLQVRFLKKFLLTALRF